MDTFEDASPESSNLAGSIDAVLEPQKDVVDKYAARKAARAHWLAASSLMEDSSNFSHVAKATSMMEASEDASLERYGLWIDHSFGPSDLRRGESLVAGGAKLTMQTDGNLVLTYLGRPIWHTGTSSGTLGDYVQLCSDGRLRVRSAQNVDVWVSDLKKESVRPVVGLTLNRKCNLRVQDSWDRVLWESGTSCQQKTVSSGCCKRR
jgi:hypothetical protein